MRYFRFNIDVILGAERDDTRAKIYNQTAIYLEIAGDMCYQNQTFFVFPCNFYEYK